jgi:hypothetical protein
MDPMLSSVGMALVSGAASVAAAGVVPVARAHAPEIESWLLAAGAQAARRPSPTTMRPQRRRVLTGKFIEMYPLYLKISMYSSSQMKNVQGHEAESVDLPILDCGQFCFAW